MFLIHILNTQKKKEKVIDYVYKRESRRGYKYIKKQKRILLK